MLRRLLFMTAWAVLVSTAAGQNLTPAAQPDTAIRQLLQKQVDAWNRHDLEGFMAGYWNSPELTFFSGGTETKGWEPTLERYRQRYQSNGAEMGKLEFAELQIVQLGSESAYVRGRWHLTMPEGKEPHGLFTLVFRKFPEGWRIVHDHTSATQ